MRKRWKYAEKEEDPISNKNIHCSAVLFIIATCNVDNPGSLCVSVCTRMCVCVYVRVCVCVCVSVSQAIPQNLLEVIIIKLGMVTPSDMVMHHMLIILTLTFIQGYTDLFAMHMAS